MNDNIKMNGETLDISEQRRQELKQLFPGVFTETTDSQGEVVESIDFEKLKAELGSVSNIYEGRRERYGMEWPGKRDCMKLIQQPSRATLKPCREESVDFDTTQNLFIEGDNLEVLKLLQKSYNGEVKMIYIDPPYNTGKEFIYPDNYQESLETYMAYAGLVDDEGKKFSTNTATEGRFHTKWLNMMYPRLYLARNLLREDGVIFISIDDNEVENLRRMCDEIFGEENFVAQFIWKSRASEDTRATSGASTDHEYVLCYRKSELGILRGAEKDLAKFSNIDDDPRGPWRSADLTGLATKDRRPNLHYNLVDPETNINYRCPHKGWRYDPRTMSNKIKEKRILWPSSQGGRPRHKLFLNEMDSMFKNISSIVLKPNTSNGTREMNELIGSGVFDFPKPSTFVKMFIDQGVLDGGVVLDFFAGSCSTAHASLLKAAQENADVEFIMVQLPEPCDKKSVAYKEGYRSISDVGKERIRRAAQKIREEREGQLDLEGEANLDLGFKVLKLDQSNFKPWQTPSAELSADQLGQQLDLHVDHIDPIATQEEILYELLLKAGYQPTDKIETLDLAGKQLFSIKDGELLICLEDEITAELIDEVVELTFGQFICLDKAFNGNDQLKANAVQTFRSRSRNAETEMVFRVV